MRGAERWQSLGGWWWVLRMRRWWALSPAERYRAGIHLPHACWHPLYAKSRAWRNPDN